MFMVQWCISVDTIAGLSQVYANISDQHSRYARSWQDFKLSISFWTTDSSSLVISRLLVVSLPHSISWSWYVWLRCHQFKYVNIIILTAFLRTTDCKHVENERSVNWRTVKKNWISILIDCMVEYSVLRLVPGVGHINKYDWLVQNMTWLATWSRLGKAKWLTATGREYDWRRRLRIVKARLQYYVHAINCNKSSRNVRLLVLLSLLTVFMYINIRNVL